MPIYEFECKKCGRVFERLCFASDKTEDLSCPSCGADEPCKLMSSFSCSSSTGDTVAGSQSCAPQRGFS